MKYLLTAILFLVVGCNSTLKTKTEDQKIVSSGESHNYVIVRLEFIEQIRQLCQDKLLQQDYETLELWKKAIADCTFNNLDIVNINPIQANTFMDTYCAPNADLSQLSEQDQLSILATCNTLNGN